MQLSPFLRTVLKLDAASCLSMAASLVLGAAIFEPYLGLPKALLTAAGIALVPIGVFMFWLGVQERGSAVLVQLVVIGNIGWALASLALFELIPEMTLLGAVVVAAQALAVILFALLEWRGLQGSGASSAS